MNFLRDVECAYFRKEKTRIRFGLFLAWLPGATPDERGRELRKTWPPTE